MRESPAKNILSLQKKKDYFFCCDRIFYSLSIFRIQKEKIFEILKFLRVAEYRVCVFFILGAMGN